MQSQPDQVQSIGVANAMSGDRTHFQITVPIVGDSELDLMAGILVLMKQIDPNGWTVERVAEWMKTRFSSNNQPEEPHNYSTPSRETNYSEPAPPPANRRIRTTSCCDNSKPL